MADPSLIPDLALRLRADDLALTDGDLIATWADASGNGRTAAQATSSFRPVYKANILNGHAVARFDGTDDSIETPSFQHGAAYTIVVVAVRTVPGSSIRSPVGGDRAGARQFQFRYPDGSNMQLIAFQTPAATGADTQPVTQGNWHVGTGVATDTAAQVFIDGTSNGATTRPTSGTDAAFVLPLVLGADNGGTDTRGAFFPGDIAEVLYWPRALTTAERASVHSYVQDTYAITVSDYTATATPTRKMRVGADAATALRVGSATATKAYLGADLVFGP